MRLIRNTGNDRVIDELKKSTSSAASLDIVSSAFSLFAFIELKEQLAALERCRCLLPIQGLSVLGSDKDRVFRNRLLSRHIANQCLQWIAAKVDVKGLPTTPPQSLLSLTDTTGTKRVITGNCPFSTDGMGILPGDQLGLIQCSETNEEGQLLAAWFEQLWSGIPQSTHDKEQIQQALRTIIEHKAPSLIYFSILHPLFSDVGSSLDEDKVIKSATGIRNTVVWKKLFKFQRDGVVGAIDKIEHYGGCIIADSVGLGKTFEALAVIKYYELRNDRVLVLCPKRLRDNWTLYKVNDRRNFLDPDRFNYDVLNHTDLSRDNGLSGDIDLSSVNWGNYDLVVIDESHNFRNKVANRDKESRYDRLMRRIIQEGVKTKVLMLSATPVNSRLNDLKNQISFVTEGIDNALADSGIPSIEQTIRLAQAQFNRWLNIKESERTSTRLLDMLGFDYFKLLDTLTIARSRKHIEKYYGISETGRFPRRLKPLNHKPNVDNTGEFPLIEEINDEIRRLNLSAYAPLRYVLPQKQAEYDKKYSTELKKNGAYFRQSDREESLVHLMRVNLLKRMESSVISFALTLQRQLEDVNGLLSKMEAHEESVEELSIEDIEIDDDEFETLLVGRKVKVLLQDVDRIRWRQDLVEDRNRMASLLSSASLVGVLKDAKLEKLKEVISDKINSPINPGNKKVLVFTAFADTANYLYGQLSAWAAKEHNLHTALVTGSGSNKTTLPKLRTDLGSVLSAFAPRAKERPQEMTAEGQIDLLIATDCISEGQNLQDCDYVINYDIHWNPVRIIQRFGRIDRIGSPNECIQLVNFWPNIELEEYINLEQRVSGRMVLLDISATGEENIIEQQAGNKMNDLEYRRKQLLKLQDTVIDLEDLSGGIAITDLTLNDFRVDLAGFLKEQPAVLEKSPIGSFAVLGPQEGIASGVIFCLRAVGDAALNAIEPGYPLAPHYLVHIGEDGEVIHSFAQTKQILDALKRLSIGRSIPDRNACDKFDKMTHNGRDMEHYQELLSCAVGTIVGKKEDRAIASLFAPGGTYAMKGEFAGINDFEVVSYIVILPEENKGVV